MPSLPLSRLFPCRPTLNLHPPPLRPLALALVPTLIWLLMFTLCKYIPSTIRPHIAVSLLPNLDEVFFQNPLGLLFFSGALVTITYLITSNTLSLLMVFVPLTLRALHQLAERQYAVLDVLGFLPYGVLHYTSPVLFGVWIGMMYGSPTAMTFLKAFGAQNILGVATQIILPSAAPWYNDLYGFAPASYAMPGNPAGLARVDKLFGTHLYTSTFSKSPLVFGALPSLHSGFAVLIFLFANHFSRKAGAVTAVYVLWQWWATMYFRHHYMVDLCMGAAYSTGCYLFFRRYLPPPPKSEYDAIGTKSTISDIGREEGREEMYALKEVVVEGRDRDRGESSGMSMVGAG
ncbi:Aureobasidin resistance protein Aur1, partial [Rhizophlyctis rosea]